MKNLLEVSRGTLHTPDGVAHEVHGGAYLTPEVYLSTHGELTALRAREAASAVPYLIAAALAGATIGFLLGRRE